MRPARETRTDSETSSHCRQQGRQYMPDYHKSRKRAHGSFPQLARHWQDGDLRAAHEGWTRTARQNRPNTDPAGDRCQKV